MKGVILTAGKGTRLLPLTQEISKCILPIGGKSIVQRSLDIMCEFDFISEICILTNIDNLEQIKEKYGENYRGRKITYTLQNIDKYGMGTASAILSAQEFIENKKALIMAGDIIVNPSDVKEMVNTYKEKPVSVMLLKTVPDPHNFGIVVLNNEDKVIEIEEKPENPKSNLINGSVYIFDNGDMKYLENIKLSKRNEFEVTDALMKMSIDGKLYGYVAKGYWDDVGNPISVLRSNKELMEELKGTDNSRYNTNKLIGNVHIEENVEIENCEIEGPCFISKNTKVINSKIRKYSYIGEKCFILDSEINNSIILDGTNIEKSIIKDSLIGNCNSANKIEINCENAKFGCVSGPYYKFEENSKIKPESKLK